jgi:DNA-binding transcriptional regulator YdaS (Cro superfamily)
MDIKTYLDTERISQAAFGKAVGVSQGLVSQWILESTPVSPAKAVLIEVATEGKVTRKELRPKDWHLIWPDLDKPAAEKRAQARRKQNRRTGEDRRREPDRRAASATPLES